MPNRSRNRGRHARVERGMPMGRAQTPVRARPVQEDPVVVLAESITPSEVAGNLHNTVKQLRARIKILEKTIKSKNAEISLSDGLVRKVEALERKLHNKEVANEQMKIDYMNKQIREKLFRRDFSDAEKLMNDLEGSGILIKHKGMLTADFRDVVTVSEKSLQELCDDGYIEHPLPDKKTRELDITKQWIDRKYGNTIVREQVTVKDWARDRHASEKLVDDLYAEIKRLTAENTQLKKQLEEDDALFKDVNQ
jgi:predicted RNase H-like nuclease (RuvC/YqgF family)